jgi:hypothetical protein
MMRHAMTKSFLLVAIACALCVGCGGSSDSEESSAAQQAEGESQPSPDEADESLDGEQTATNNGAEATETNFVPAVCLADADCPDGVACLPFDAEAGGPGICDLDEVEVQ